MSKIFAIQFRTTRDQYERIKDNARVKGFRNLTDYLRFVALEKNSVVENKILEIHRFLIGNSQAKSKPRKSPGIRE